MECRVSLEPAAEVISVASVKSPLIFELPSSVRREKPEGTQNRPVSMYPAEVSSYMVNTGTWGRIPMYLTIPECMREPADAISYIHGAGWAFGSSHTHKKLVREPAARTDCTIAFPEYSRSPEACYPVVIEQCFSVPFYLQRMLSSIGINMSPDTLTVAGDSVGGNMAIVVTLMTKYRRGPKIQKQLLYYPITNAYFDTGSHCEFAEGYYLYQGGMKWSWSQYTPSPQDRSQITASLLYAICGQSEGLPEALAINGEADALRDEGKAYVRALRCAGISATAVRFQAMIHDFVMLHSLDQTNAYRAVMDPSMS